MKGYRCLFKNSVCLLALLPLSLACLGGFGGSGSQCCPPRAAPTCPVVSQCGQPSYGAPSYSQQIPQYSAPQQPPQLPYYPPPQPQYQQPSSSYINQPPSPQLIPSYVPQSQAPPQPFGPPLNNGNTYNLQPPASQPAIYEKYQPSPATHHQKPQAPGSQPHTTTTSNFGRKAGSKQETSTTSSGSYGSKPPADPYNFVLQDDENDITESNAQQVQVESSNKKVESSSNESNTNDNNQ